MTNRGDSRTDGQLRDPRATVERTVAQRRHRIRQHHMPRQTYAVPKGILPYRGQNT